MPLRTSPDIEEKIVHIRKTIILASNESYLLRYHGIKIAGSTVHMVLMRHGLNHLPKKSTPQNSAISF